MKTISKITRTPEFERWLKKANRDFKSFITKLDLFLNEFFSKREIKPLEYSYEMFWTPDIKPSSEPILRVIFNRNKDFNALELNNEIFKNFRDYLIEDSPTEKKFLKMMKILRYFGIFIRWK